jgi:hypothetical protein
MCGAFTSWLPLTEENPPLSWFSNNSGSYESITCTYAPMSLENQSSPTAIDKVRASRDGHTYHETWAARVALGLLYPSTTLRSITVEGFSVEARSSSGLAPQARPLTKIQGPHSVPHVPSFRQSDALGIAECGTKPHRLGRSEGHQQAQAASSSPSGKGCLANTRRSGSALSDHRADWTVLRFANQRNPLFAVDGAN